MTAIFFAIIDQLINSTVMSAIGSFILVAVLFGIWRAVLGKDELLATMKVIEAMIWGRSLDKENWDKGEKLPKVKIKWKIKKELKKEKK